MSGRAGASALAVYRAARRRRWTRVGAAVLLLAAALAVHREAAPTAVALVFAGAGLSSLVAAFSGGSGRDPDRWRRGAEGERLTARLLDALPSRRWAVWHDLAVPGSRANIDHLVVGRTGVWVVDTKTTRAPVRAGWRSVRFGEHRLDAGPTRWEAEVLADRLQERLGDLLRRPVPVRPIIAVHGSGLRERGATVQGVRVVPAGLLVHRLRRGRRRLGRSARALVCRAVAEEFGPSSRAGISGGSPTC